MTPAPLLSLPDAVAFLRRVREAQAAGTGGAAAPSIPRRLVQFWDRDPPAEVQRLLERNASLCAARGVEHRLFDDAAARQFLVERADETTLAAYDVAPHPAMKSDVFRLAFLASEGGYYLDADMALRESFAPLYDESAELAVFQWTLEERTNVCNWLFGSAASSEGMHFVLSATAASVVEACARDASAALRDILSVSGPGLFTRAVATWAARGEGEGRLVSVRTVDYAYRHVQNGPEYLKAKLAYKETERHWLVAARNRAAR